MPFLFSITWGTVSGWWAPVCVLSGLLYAWLLYRRPVNLSDKFRYMLFAARALTVTFVCLLLVSPLIKSVKYDPQKPLVLVLQDNSQSVNIFRPQHEQVTPAAVVDQLSKLKQQLGDTYDVREFHFDKELHDSLTKTFNGRQTDLSHVLRQLDDRFVNENIGAVVIASDGLYNQGTDPQYDAKNFKSSIYTIALGDTVARRDLLIGNINYNKTAFLGNDFEVEVLTEAYQSAGENIMLTVAEDGRKVSSQNITVTSASFQKQVTLKLNADKKGLHRFDISIAPVKNEISTQNNSETIYVEVLDAKQKILLLYEAPHPDITVIKQAIEANKNYEVKTSLVSDLGTLKLADYNPVLLYQLTSASNGAIQGVLKSKAPLWFFAGGQTDLNNFNRQQKVTRISSGRPEMQEVFATPTTDFTAFTLSDSSRSKISRFPPLLAPYGSYTLPPPGNVLLKQRIGTVETAFPLLSFDDEGGRRTGVLNAEGIWRWQLAGYQAYGSHSALDELFGQAVQYLTANANRQRFSVYSAKHVFDEGEDIILNAELYNDALELVNTPDVRIELKSKTGKRYSFLFSRNDQSYMLDAGALPVGEYTYAAATKLGEKQFNQSGQLTVKPLNLEMRQTAANHQLLNTISRQSGGRMLQPAQTAELAKLIRKDENVKTVVYEDKRYHDIIDVKWMFVVILVLLTAEWFLRKREGEI
ncbi:MAG TPA: hypothetical protein VHA56_18285 [Mucilaginibacter sp.]|nr:hypothetical protein [Mucilaginibacter sp.]